MREQPIIAPGAAARSGDDQRIGVDGVSFAIHEWRGSGPPYMHVHHEDDEAWHVLEGRLTFRFADRTLEAEPETTVFVPAGVAHTYQASPDARYLVVLTPRLRSLIAELQSAPRGSDLNEIFRKHSSEIVQPSA